jgi:hypothetical protein
MKPWRFFLSPAALIAAALLACDAAAAQSVRASVCEIAKHPERFEGRTVRVQASLIGNFHHGWLLVESGCNGGLEFKTPSDSREGDSPLARWNTFMWFTWPEAFPFPGYDRDSYYEIDIDLELVGVVRSYAKDADDWSGSNWAAKSRVGPSRGTRQVSYIDVSTVESARFYRLAQPRHEMR